MNPVILLKPEEDMIEKVHSLLVKDEEDYSENLVVFPGKRPGHYLRKVIAEKSGKAFIPPVIFSMDEFINFIFMKAYDYNDALKGDVIAILYELSKDHEALHPEFKALDNFYSFGIRLFKAIEELYIENISSGELRARETLIDIPQKSSIHLRFLSDIYERFYRELIKRKLSTRALRYRMVAEMDNGYPMLNGFKRVILAGFFAFTESEKNFFKKLIEQYGEERLLFLFHEGDGIRENLKPLGIEVEPWEDQSILKPSISIYSAPDIHGEIKIAGELIKSFPEIDEKTVIVLPQAETLFPLIREGIPYLNEVDFNISMGYPLSRTPLCGFFLTLFELLLSMEGDLVYLPHYLKFMLHPYTKNIKLNGRSELNRIVFHELEDLTRKKNIIPFVKLENIENQISERIYQNIKDMASMEGITIENIKTQFKVIHDNTLRRFIPIKSIGDFVEKLRDVLLFIYKESTARLHPLFLPYMETFIKELESTANSELRSLSFEKRESYFNFFKKLIASTTIPFEGTPLRGLQLLGFLETRNIKFKKILFLDLNEGVFPDLSEDYILPFKIRKSLGMPTYKERELLMHYYFKTLLSQAEEVHLFYTKNDRTERSRFLEKLLWDMEKSGKPIREKTVNYQIRLSTGAPSEIKKNSKIIEVLNTISLTASSLDDYLQCGIKFYYNNVLSLKKGKDTLDPDRAEVGSIVHEVLSRFFSQGLNEKVGSRAFSKEDMERIIKELFYERYGQNISGRLYLLRHQIIKRLTEFLDIFTESFKEGQIISIEEELTEPIQNTLIRGRIDMVLRKEGNQFIIIDYKISSGNDKYKLNLRRFDRDSRETWPEAIKSLQIPVYMLLYSKRYKIDIENINGNYLLLGMSTLNDKTIYSPLSVERKKQEMEILSNLIGTLIDEIKNPEIPFRALEKLKDYCPRCDYKPLCGTEWVKGFKF